MQFRRAAPRSPARIAQPLAYQRWQLQRITRHLLTPQMIQRKMHFLVFGQLSEQLIQSHRIVAAGQQVIDGLLGAQLQTGAAVAG